MENHEIALNAAKIFPDMTAYLYDGKCLFKIRYDYDSDEEDSWDAAEDIIWDMRESFKDSAFETINIDFDHDTIWGEVIIKKVDENE